VPGKLRDWLAQFSTKALLMIIIAAASVLPLLSLIRFILKRRRDRARASLDYASSGPELLAAARRFERLIQRVGIICVPNRTWREQAYALNPLCLEFIDVYEQARFGGRDGVALKRALALLDEMEQLEVQDGSSD
jgi:hypothetical protein